MTTLFSFYKSQSKTLTSSFHSLNRYFLRRSYGSKRKIISATDAAAFRTSFLQNQCGLSGKSLIRASNLLNYKLSDERPISVLKLFQTFGFPHPNITKIISTAPNILQYHSEKILKPKLEFLVSITQSQTDVVRMLTTYPNILRVSLHNQLIPAFNLLHSVTGSYQNAVAAVKCRPHLLSDSVSKRVLPNFEFLHTLGVPTSRIVKLTTSYGTVLGKKHDQFCKIVTKIKEMGFDLSSSYFIQAVHALSFNTDSSWESRCELFRRFGFTDDEILSMFKKLPYIMCFSEKRVRGAIEFFVNQLGCSPSRLSDYPVVLAYSLEKRIIPRCSVLQVLVSKNSISPSFRLSTMLCMSEKKFLESYVTAYKDEIPDIMDAYRGKLKFDVYNFEQKGGLRLKPNIHSRSVISSN